jgi:hypothetical protein
LAGACGQGAHFEGAWAQGMVLHGAGGQIFDGAWGQGIVLHGAWGQGIVLHGAWPEGKQEWPRPAALMARTAIRLVIAMSSMSD